MRERERGEKERGEKENASIEPLSCGRMRVRRAGEPDESQVRHNGADESWETAIKDTAPVVIRLLPFRTSFHHGLSLVSPYASRAACGASGERSGGAHIIWRALCPFYPGPSFVRASAAFARPVGPQTFTARTHPLFARVFAHRGARIHPHTLRYPINCSPAINCSCSV